MVGIGDRHGVKTMALITRMDQPLGREVGNSNEIRESIDVLRGEGPQDVVELTLAFGEVMLELGGVEGGRSRLRKRSPWGRAAETCRRGGGPRRRPGGSPRSFLAACRAARRCHRGRHRRLRDPMRCPDRRHGRHPARCRRGNARRKQVDHGVGITLEAKVGRSGPRRGSPGHLLASPTRPGWETQGPLLSSAGGQSDASQRSPRHL